MTFTYPAVFTPKKGGSRLLRGISGSGEAVRHRDPDLEDAIDKCC